MHLWEGNNAIRSFGVSVCGAGRVFAYKFFCGVVFVKKRKYTKGLKKIGRPANSYSADPSDFVNIARALGVSVATIKVTYDSAIRKIRWYLMTHRQLRRDLQDNLDFLDMVRGKTDTRDMPSKMED